MQFQGKVIKGAEVGGKFGIATANLKVLQKPELKEGVYFVEVTFLKNSNSEKNLAPAIMHFGERQTFGRDFTIEIHLLDFNQDIYEENLEINVLQYCRPIKKFQNADLLFTQIETDINHAQKFFARKIVQSHWEKVSTKALEDFAKKTLDKISKNSKFQTAKNIFIFAPIKQEIPFVEKLCQKFPDKNYHFPQIKNKEIQFFLSTYKALNPGQWNILEPEETTPITPKSEEVIFVPALAADNEGNRLGRGGGFYDQFLAKHQNSHTITILPEFARFPKVPTEPHDQRVKEVVFVSSPQKGG
jgi:5,10-methenyltetrahydrofolate synthetase